MKNFKKILIIIASLLFINLSCKKDKTTNSDNTSIIEQGLTVYKNTANSNDVLISTYYDVEQARIVYMYGNTNNDGRGIVVKSITYEQKGNDTLINIILDSVQRPAIMYASTKAGIKINQLFQYNYLDDDSIMVSFYKYNWTNNSDSLMAQYITKDNEGRTLYGARSSSNNDVNSPEYLAALTTTIFIGVLCPIAAGYIVGVVFEGGVFAQAVTTIGTALVLWTDVANAATLSANIPNTPSSPKDINWTKTFTNTKYPNTMFTHGSEIGFCCKGVATLVTDTNTLNVSIQRINNWYRVNISAKILYYIYPVDMCFGSVNGCSNSIQKSYSINGSWTVPSITTGIKNTNSFGVGVGFGNSDAAGISANDKSITINTDFVRLDWSGQSGYPIPIFNQTTVNLNKLGYYIIFYNSESLSPTNQGVNRYFWELN